MDIHSDDYWHYAFINDALPIKEINDISLFKLFSFVDADPERLVQLVDIGFLPWWTYEGYKIMFWRPLSELTHWLDYTLWPSHGGVMHFQSILWYLALLTVLFKLYGRLQVGKLAVGLAVLFYAVDASHAVNLTWIAGRNALLATFFGLSVLYFHVRARQDEWILGHFLALLCLVLGLLSAEYHMAVGAYLFAYAVILDKKGAIKGFVSLLPYLFVVGAWWMFYKNAGFGAEGTNGFYLDPVEDPIVYLTAMSHRIVALLGSQWGFVPADLYRGGMRPYQFAMGVLVLLAVLYLLKPLFKDKLVRFWCLGMLISALPACAPAPSDRFLLYIGLGACGILGVFFQYWYDGLKSGNALSKGRVVVANTMVAFQLVIPVLLFPLVMYSTQIAGDSIRDSAASISNTHNVEGKKLVLFNSPAWLTTYLYTIWYHDEVPLPNKVWGLTTENTVNRGNEGFLKPVSEYEVEVSLKDGFMTGFDKIYRDYQAYTLDVGDVVKLDGMSIRIVALTEDLRPKTVIFKFDLPLNDPDLIWLIYNKDHQYVDLEMPEIGETIALN
ncbi:MAG: hypothetical protein KUG82_12590 [Pseudomonadales bacterium]|nr:hypothetical protein [Pseudomonadales bacterium]